MDLLLHFNELRELHIYCSDEDGITLALRKMHMPALEKLNMAYIGRPSSSPSCRYNTSKAEAFALYPALDSIFREPRLVKLTNLALSGFSLVVGRVTAALAYMPELQEVTIEFCQGTPACPIS